VSVRRIDESVEGEQGGQVKRLGLELHFTSMIESPSLLMLQGRQEQDEDRNFT
jgi:hypothetical protein